MPLTALIRKVRGDGSTRWRLVGSQMVLAAGIFLALVLSWALVDRALAVTSNTVATFAPGLANRMNVDVGVAPTIITVVVLLLVLGSIEIAAAIYGLTGSSRGKDGPKNAIRKQQNGPVGEETA